jgi:alkanesulfonate monooxygenase SsuD/methylene tetrahydromethanopterin reductase-like flavin-dependent oxidoreductase (luciferase family)
MLAAIALQTKSILIGAFMTALPRRRPWKLAREMLTLDLLSHGRIICWVGLGYQPEEFFPFGESADPGERAEKLDEGLDILDGLWRGQPFQYQGKHYRVDLPAHLPRPIQSPRIPIWVAGGWPRRKPLRRAARWDGIYLMTYNQVTRQMLSPAEIQEIKAYIFSWRKSETPFDIAVNVETTINPRQSAKIVAPFFEAGATWCIDLAPDTPEQYRARIQAGPPER